MTCGACTKIVPYPVTCNAWKWFATAARAETQSHSQREGAPLAPHASMPAHSTAFTDSSFSIEACSLDSPHQKLWLLARWQLVYPFQSGYFTVG